MATGQSFADFMAAGGVAANTFERVALERLELGSRRDVQLPFAMNGLRVLMRALEDDVSGMALELRAYVWQEVLQNERVTLAVDESGAFEAAWPATWWEHFKQRWFPAWALARWPVKLETKRETWRVQRSETHEFKTCAVLPGFKCETPGVFVLRTSVRKV